MFVEPSRHKHTSDMLLHTRVRCPADKVDPKLYIDYEYQSEVE